MSQELFQGKVKFYNQQRGFGFIKIEDGTEYFVHATGLRSGKIAENDLVSFKLKEGKKGLNAIDVEVK